MGSERLARCKGAPGSRSEAEPQASIDRVRNVAQRTLAPRLAGAMRRKEAARSADSTRLDEKERMERNDGASHATDTTTRPAEGRKYPSRRLCRGDAL